MPNEQFETAKQNALDAVALLTASFNGATGDVIRQFIAEGAQSDWYQPNTDTTDPRIKAIEINIQHLSGSLERLTNVLDGMVIVTKNLVKNYAKLNDAEPADVLEALGRQFTAIEPD